MIFDFIPFWEKERYKDAHLARVNLPKGIVDIINNWWKNPHDILFFSGNPGCGKSYLIAAMIHDLQEKKKTNWRYMSERDFFAIMRKTIDQDWDYMIEIQRLCDSDMLFLDDIGCAQMTDFQKECLGALIDERSQSSRPTIITSNLYLADMHKIMHPRVISRLRDQNNVIIELNWVDKRQRNSDATEDQMGGAVNRRKRD